MLCFLPAYSSELSKIERLWHRCKHYWLTPADYVCEDIMQRRVADVLNKVGSTCTITFG